MISLQGIKYIIIVKSSTDVNMLANSSDTMIEPLKGEFLYKSELVSHASSGDSCGAALLYDIRKFYVIPKCAHGDEVKFLPLQVF